MEGSAWCQSLSGHLTCDEMERLKQGLPDFSTWCPELLVPFQVTQLASPNVLWVNRRWFLERGIDISHRATEDRIILWLREEFGYAVLDAVQVDGAFTAKTKMAHADRYGSSSGLAPHGGSGRSAVYGCFQAKGVGATPLVGVSASATHRNGCASIHEGIREAIYSEIMAAEFPFGAVPVIALLDSGLSYQHSGDEGKNDSKIRRAIIVRPSIFRPAHAERAALFKESTVGYINSQADDVTRTRAAVKKWAAGSFAEGKPEVPSVQETLGRVAEQMAFGQVHRLFGGGCFSSNLTVAGQIHDFGNAHPLPDWCGAKVLEHVDGFGDELRAISTLARSLDFYFRKYSDAGQYLNSFQELLDHAVERYEERFRHECLRLWHIESVKESIQTSAIVTTMTAFFKEQQRTTRRYRQGRIAGVGDSVKSKNWLYAALVDECKSAARASSAASNVVSCVISQLEAIFEGEPSKADLLWVSRLTAIRMLKPRASVDRGILLGRIRSLVESIQSSIDRSRSLVTDFIDLATSTGRASWPSLPSGLAVIAHVSRDGCSALLCARRVNEPLQLWLKGIAFEGRVYVFGVWFTGEQIAPYKPSWSSSSCAFSLPLDDVDIGRDALKIGSKVLRIPKFETEI